MMKQEEKDLLLKDLCSRLPHGVKCEYYDCYEGDYYEGTIRGFERQEYIQIDGVCIHIEEVKPYLFPLSSMTEEQEAEYDATFATIVYEDGRKDSTMTYKSFDWLNKNHFDYRGLIEKGLANDATGLKIY